METKPTTASTTLLVVLFLIYFGTQCSANVLCYVCVWIPNSASPTDEKNDNCRPGRLNVNDILVESCPNGCFINVLHQNEPEPEHIGNLTDGTRGGIHQWSNCTDNSVLMNMKDMNMTIYKRRCSEKQVHRNYCQVTHMAGFREEKRFCRTDYCNGDSGSVALVLPGSIFLSFLLGFTLLSLAAFIYVPTGSSGPV